MRSDEEPKSSPILERQPQRYSRDAVNGRERPGAASFNSSTRLGRGFTVDGHPDRRVRGWSILPAELQQSRLA